jgi:hypothetical protein
MGIESRQTLIAAPGVVLSGPLVVPDGLQDRELLRRELAALGIGTANASGEGDGRFRVAPGVVRVVEPDAVMLAESIEATLPFTPRIHVPVHHERIQNRVPRERR